jgi:hypothetical protein
MGVAWGRQKPESMGALWRRRRNPDKHNKLNRVGSFGPYFSWTQRCVSWRLLSTFRDSVVVPSSRAQCPIKNAEFLHRTTLSSSPLLHVTAIIRNPRSAMPWCEGTQLAWLHHKTCCVIDTRTCTDSKWRNRATLCVAMRWSTTMTGFKPEMVTPSSELARNCIYSELFNAARWTKALVSSRTQQQQLLTSHEKSLRRQRTTTVLQVGMHSAVISNKITTKYSSIIHWMLQDGIITWCTKLCSNTE